MALPALNSKVEILSEDADYCLAMWHDTVICVWSGKTSLECLARQDAACLQVIKRTRHGTYLGVIGVSSPAPDDACRAALARWSRDLCTKLAKVVIVAEGGWFRAALVRGVGTALTTLLPHRIPITFATDVMEGSQRLGPALPLQSGGAEALLEVVKMLRKRLNLAPL